MAQSYPQGIGKTRSPYDGGVNMKTMRLNEIAYARSGDKGDISNIVVIAKKPEDYRVIEKKVTAEVVKEH